MATKIGVKHGPPTSASACQICRMVESSFFVEFLFNGSISRGEWMGHFYNGDGKWIGYISY